MKNKLAQLLKITPEAYDEKVFMIYMQWCQKKAISNNNLQELLANAQIEKWFSIQLALRQSQFVGLMESVPHAAKNPDYHYHYFVNELYSLYPKALIDEASHKIVFPLRITDEIYAN